MQKATSADGTTIAYDRWGSGPLVVIVGGAFNDRGAWAELAQALADRFTVVSYDRRGRGDSGDAQPYAVEREIEDLAAVIEAASPDATAFAHGVSSGGALVLRAVTVGAPISKASVLEPPYRTEGAPPIPDDYVGRLNRFIAEGKRGEAIEFFHTEAVGLPAEIIEPMKGTPAWGYLESMAHTLAYDGEALGGDDHSVPTDMLAGVTIPVLTVSSTGTAPWLGAAAAAVAEAVPGARHRQLEGGFHEVPVQVLAPALTAFYTEMG
ncbi:MAG: alpha/beta fold hydrolase [Jiangellaceae bacterium]